MLVDSPIGSSNAMMDTKVVSLNSPIKVETILGIEIFNACGMIINRVACQ